MRETPNRILDFLTAPAKPDGDACRSNPRRRTSCKVELSWTDGKSWLSISGRLRDISKGGASLVARSAPPRSQLARLRIVEGDGTPWIEAEILGSEPHARSRHRIRIKFAEPCPAFLLRMSVLGDTPPENEPTAPYEWVARKSVGSE